MIQNHSIVLWRKADKKGRYFDDVAEDAFYILNILQEYPANFRPNYLTTTSKKNIQKLDWDLQVFKEALKQGGNKEGKSCFDELGYSISMFSSLNEHDSFSFQMRVGNRNERFYNSLVIGIPISIDLFKEDVVETVSDLFKNVSYKFNPFWGCISNKSIAKKYGEFLRNDIPTTVHWQNYWGKEIECKIGKERIRNTLNKYSQTSFENGIFKMQKLAIDSENIDAMKYHSAIETSLGLN